MNDSESTPIIATVAICTRNRCETLRSCLPALEEQVDEGITWEILVVDNGSEDGTSDMVSRFSSESRVHVRLSSEPEQGLSFARNRAVQESRGRLLFFIDDDFKASPGWLAAHVAAYENPDVLGTAGRIIPELSGEIPEWISGQLDDPFLCGPLARYDFGDDELDLDPEGGGPGHPFGCNMGVRRDAAVQVGGFRVDIGWGKERIPGEETEFFDRIRDLKGRLLYIPKAHGLHMVNATRLDPVRFDQFHHGLGQAQIRTYPPSSRFQAMILLARESCKLAERTVSAPFSSSTNLRKRAARARSKGRTREALHQLWSMPGYSRGLADAT